MVNAASSLPMAPHEGPGTQFRSGSNDLQTEEIAAAAAELDDEPPEAILRWAVAQLPPSTDDGNRVRR